MSGATPLPSSTTTCRKRRLWRAIAAAAAIAVFALGSHSVPATAATEPAYYGTLTCTSGAFYVQLPGTYTSEVFSYYSYRVSYLDNNGNFTAWTPWQTTTWFYSLGHEQWKYLNGSWIRWGDGFMRNLPTFAVVQVWTYHQSALYKGWKYLGQCQT